MVEHCPCGISQAVGFYCRHEEAGRFSCLHGEVDSGSWIVYGVDGEWIKPDIKIDRSETVDFLALLGKRWLVKNPAGIFYIPLDEGDPINLGKPKNK